MSQITAVATRGGCLPGDDTLRRLTVQADSVRADLVLSASVPLESLIPSIVDILSGSREYQPGPVSVRYQLSLPGNVALNSSKTLTQLGIKDGAALLLTGSSAELAVPRLDDAAEAVSESLAGTERRWTRRVSRLVAVLVAMWLAVVSAALLIRALFVPNDLRADDVVVATTTGLLTLLAAGVAYRVFREESAGLALGLIACGFAAVAGALIVPGEPGAPNAVFAAAATATSAAVLCAIGCHTVIFTALTCFAVAGTTAALADVVTSFPLPAIGATLAVIALILIEVSAPISIMLAGLSPRPSADSNQPVLPADGLGAQATRARALLTSMVIAFSACTALGAIGATVGPHLMDGPRLPGTAFATLTGGVLLLRARAHHDLAMSLPLIVSGTVTLSAALVAATAAYPVQSAHIAAASIGLAAVALCLGHLNRPTTVSPIGQRGVELLEYLALAAVVPLAAWVCGLYGAARGLNLP